MKITNCEPQSLLKEKVFVLGCLVWGGFLGFFFTPLNGDYDFLLSFKFLILHFLKLSNY